jgi:putative inorganic carbon (hco3(-)) transporter
VRDVFLLLPILLALPFIFWRPWVGAVLWATVSYFNPQALAWGFASSFPFALLVAVTTILSLVFHLRKLHFPRTREVLLLGMLFGWVVLTTFTSKRPDLAFAYLDRVSKILVMTAVTIAVITDRKSLNYLIWSIALCVGFYGIKGGLFTIATGGSYRVWGPTGTMIGGNNEIALALITVVPLWIYLSTTVKSVWARNASLGAALLCCAAIVGSQSRGALLGIAAMGSVYWWRSGHKFTSGIGVAAVAIAVLLFMPQKWFDRMETIGTYQADESAMMRINSWQFALNLAADHPIVGGGFKVFSDPEMYKRYAPNPEWVLDAHSIWFQVLGEQGWVGLAIFVSLGISTLLSAGRLRSKYLKDPSNKWVADLASMLQVAAIGYFVAGSFLSLAYLDLYYHLVALVVLAGALAKAPATAPAAVTAVREKPVLMRPAR